MSVLEELDLGEAVRLFTIQSEEGQVNSVIPLRWCISPEAKQMLVDRNITNPHLLIVVSHGGRAMDKYVVPLTAEMQYIRFQRPGVNTIHATIIWREHGGEQPKEALEHYDCVRRYQPKAEALREQYYQLLRERDENVIRFEAGEDGVEDLSALMAEQMEKMDDEIDELQMSEPYAACIPLHLPVLRVPFEATLDVNVPEAMFASKPNWLLNELGTLYWESRARDQCQLRRRAITAGVTLPIATCVVLVVLTVLELFNLLVAAVLLLFGARNISFDAITAPWEDMPNTAWADLKPSVWWTKEVPPTDGWRRATYENRSPFFALLNPPVLLFFGLFLALYPVGFLFKVALVGGALVAGLLAVWALAYKLTHRYDVNEEKERREQERERRRKEELARELELLACDTRPREVSLGALPKERRTVSLRYQDLKSKVCKPFAA